MREIKFRVWCDGNIYNDRGMYGPFGFNDIYSGREEAYINCYPNRDLQEPDFDKLIIMQYTGLKDKNGKEIYEGDIIKQHDEILTVFYNDDTACFDVQFLGGDCEGLYTSDFEKYPPEIIGNIHENPELLEK